VKFYCLLLVQATQHFIWLVCLAIKVRNTILLLIEEPQTLYSWLPFALDVNQAIHLIEVDEMTLQMAEFKDVQAAWLLIVPFS
jgi:hypothetical protein